MIYVAAFKDIGNVDHLIFYNKMVTILNHPTKQPAMNSLGLLYIVFDAWYAELRLKPSKKHKDRSSGGAGAPRAGQTWRQFKFKLLLMVTRYCH